MAKDGDDDAASALLALRHVAHLVLEAAFPPGGDGPPSSPLYFVGPRYEVACVPRCDRHVPIV